MATNYGRSLVAQVATTAFIVAAAVETTATQIRARIQGYYPGDIVDDCTGTSLQSSSWLRFCEAAR
ncbi:hypothetical protein DPMN_117550 [Dreissena polymorpha]|uniref:Uncharacterized protein n=1 Tax=Dreissena polymorpha TaxID=45954 RepID=A0A9D4KR42_DREPO|nr:hypothetical protein DPMN_117550 [Dreissena polymorpha]